jgi:hypothetical protein
MRPFDVAAWPEQLHQDHLAPSLKRQLAAARLPFDWLTTAQVVQSRS